jgi:oligopeptide/dipeptide ABC transporter ATP-binding protein
MSVLVTARNLTRRFGSRRGLFGRERTMIAVNELSLDIERGRVVGVVGESGCGKSTLARLILRLIEPSEGGVTFDGVDLMTLPAKELRLLRRRMQMVFQDPYSAVDPRYRIRDALLEPFQVQDLRPADPEEMVQGLLEMVGLNPEFADRYPHQLSGGQKQRVGIARALALKPSFLVLDEPTASLDVSIQAQIIGLLEGLKRELGLTYLFISHDLGLVRYFCDQVVVMYLGRIVEIFPRSALAPRHPYASALLDSSFEPDPTRRRKIERLTGEVPSAFDLPPGCAFASRCSRATDLCRRVRPELVVLSPDESIACHHPLNPAATS